MCDWKDNVSCGEAVIGGGKEVEELVEVGELMKDGEHLKVGDLQKLGDVGELEEMGELGGQGEQGDVGGEREHVEQFIKPVGQGEQWENWENGNEGEEGKPGEQGNDGAVGREEGQELRTWLLSKLAGQHKVTGQGLGLGSKGKQIKKSSVFSGSGSKVKAGVEGVATGVLDKRVGDVGNSSSKAGARPAALVQKSSSNLAETASGGMETAGSSWLLVLVAITLLFAGLKD